MMNCNIKEATTIELTLTLQVVMKDDHCLPPILQIIDKSKEERRNRAASSVT